MMAWTKASEKFRLKAILLSAQAMTEWLAGNRDIAVRLDIAASKKLAVAIAQEIIAECSADCERKNDNLSASS